MAGIEAFVKDLEDLGVDVTVSATGVTENWGKGPSVTVISLVLEDFEEDLEPELGNPHRRLDRWVKPHEEDLEAG